MPIDQPPPAPPAIVVVRAARLPTPVGDRAFSVVRVTPHVLATSDRLDHALGTIAGFSLFRRTSSLGANPTTQGVSLRAIAGSGASRALVTLDGVPQNDPFGGWVIWTGLPPEAVASAALVRGAGAGPYGAGALTGVVALEQPTAVPGHIAGDVEGGSLGYARAAAITEIDAGPTRAFFDGSAETSDGWVPVRQGRGAADRPLNLDDWSLAERIETDVGPAVLSERITGFQEDRGAGTVFAGSRVRGGQASVTLVQAPSTGALGWRVQGWVSTSNLANTTASVSANRNVATLADNQYATPAMGYGLNAALRRAEAAYTWEIGADVRAFYGGSREQLFTLGQPSGARSAGGGEAVAGLYAEGSRNLGPWLLTGGVRLDGWEVYDSSLIQTGSTTLNQHPGDRGGVVPTGRLGLRRDLAGGFYLRTAAYAGFRPATLNELHRPFRVGNDVTEANAALSPERLYGVEAGIGGDRLIHWDLDLFYNQLANAITNVTIGRGPGSFPGVGFVPAGGTLFQRQNAGVINAVGLEGESDYAAGQPLELRAGFAWTHARVDGGSQAPQLTGLRPAETPELTVTAGAVWRPLARLTLSADARYESKRYDDDQNTRPIEPGLGVDARAEWRIAGLAAVYIQANNLFDAAIQTGRNASGVVTYDAPTMVTVGLTIRR